VILEELVHVLVRGRVLEIARVWDEEGRVRGCDTGPRWAGTAALGVGGSVLRGARCAGAGDLGRCEGESVPHVREGEFVPRVREGESVPRVLEGDFGGTLALALEVGVPEHAAGSGRVSTW